MNNATWKIIRFMRLFIILLFLILVVFVVSILVSIGMMRVNSILNIRQKDELEEQNNKSLYTLVDGNLLLGARGEKVRTLQAALAMDKNLYSSGIVSGYFGVLTRDALFRFQQRCNLDQTGSLDTETREMFNKIFGDKPSSYYLRMISSLPLSVTQELRTMQNRKNSDEEGLDWGEVKQVGEHTYVTKVGIDVRMGTSKENMLVDYQFVGVGVATNDGINY